MSRILAAFIALLIFSLLFTALNTEGLLASSQEKLLAVVVNVYGDSISVEGYCIYIKGGEEIKKELKKDGAWGWNFKGDYIKEVKLQKIAGDASYQVFVIEGDNFVFESSKTNSTEPIVYKRSG